MKRRTAREPLIVQEWGVRLGNAYASESGVKSPSAKNYSSRSAVCGALRLHDAQSGWTLADGRGCRTLEAGDSRHRMIKHRRENARGTEGTIAQFATHTWPAPHGPRIGRVDGAEILLLRLEHVPHYRSMVAPQLISGALALSQHYFPIERPLFCEHEKGHRNDATQYWFALPSVLPWVKRRLGIQE